MNKYIRLEAIKRLSNAMQINMEQAENIMDKLVLEVRGNRNDSSKDQMLTVC